MHWRRNGENGYSIHKSTTISNESAQRHIILFAYNRIPSCISIYCHAKTGNNFSIFIANKESWIQKINLLNLPRRSLTMTACIIWRPIQTMTCTRSTARHRQSSWHKQDPVGFVPGSYWRILIECNASIDWTERLVHRPQWLYLRVLTLLNLWKVHGSRKVQ